MLERCKGKIDHVRSNRITPFAAPLLLEKGRVSIEGTVTEALLAEQSERLMAEVGLT